MATKNIVPNADSEGQLGTSSKFWSSAYLDGLNIGNDAAANLVFTPSASDTITLAAAANGAFTITTVDAAAAAANVGFVVDGNFTVSNVTSTITSSSSDITTFATTNATSGYTEFAYNTSTVAGYIGNGTSLLSGAANTDFIMRSESGAVKFTTGGGNLALTLDTSQDATFAGNVKVGSSATVTPATNADDIVIDKGASESGITIVSTAAASLRFGDADNASIGYVEYNHSTDAMRFGTANAGSALTIAEYGLLTITTGSSTNPRISFAGTNVSGTHFIQLDRGSGASDSAFEVYVNGATRFEVKAGGDAEIADGNLVIGTAGHGIDFAAESPSGSGSANTILDDYEEGTFTATILNLTGSNPTVTGAGSSAPENVTGQYVKIGQMVHIQYNSGEINISNLNGGSSAAIGGLPFASASGHTGVITVTHSVNFSAAVNNGFISSGSSSVGLVQDNTTNYVNWVASGDTFVMIGGTYITTS